MTPSARARAGLAVTLLAAAVLRRDAVVGLAVVGVVLVPLERVVPLRRQRILRPGLATDLTHLLVNGVLVAAATLVLVIVGAIPLLPLRRLDLGIADPVPRQGYVAHLRYPFTRPAAAPASPPVPV